MASMNLTTMKIFKWAEDKNFDDVPQLHKIDEEVTELFQAYAESKHEDSGVNKNDVREEMADVIISTIAFGQVFGLSPKEFSDEIARKAEIVLDRDGEVIDGKFVKQSDLEGSQ